MTPLCPWTDLIAAGTWLRAVHLNELRWSCETLRRGRWKMPIYFSAGIIHHVLYPELDDSPWIGGLIAKSIWGEVRTIGFAVLATEDAPPARPSGRAGAA